MKDIFNKTAKVRDEIVAINEGYTTTYIVTKTNVKHFGKPALKCKLPHSDEEEYVRRMFLITRRGDRKFYTG